MDLLEQLIKARTEHPDGDHEPALAALLNANADADLNAMVEDAIARTYAIGDIPEDSRTDADMDALETMVDVVSALRVRQEEMATQRAARAARAAEALARVKPPTKGADAADGVDGDGDGGDGADEDDEDKTRAAKSGKHAVVELSGDAGPVKVIEAALVPTPRAPLGAVPSDRPVRFGTNYKPRPIGGSFTIEAASEMPGIAAGQDLGDLAGLARVVHRRVQGLERAGVGHADIATIRRTVPDHHYAQNGGEEETVSLEQLAAIGAERSEALVASGGWCSPSEVLYDLCETATMEGLLDHPTVVVRRGGLRWPQTPDFSTVYSSIGFTQTEAQAAAGTTKPCYDVPCPGFSDNRLSAIGLCLRAGILTAQAYPELVEWFVQQALVAHAHQVNAYKLAQMVAQATTVHFATTGTAPNIAASYGPGAFASILGVLEMQVEDLRAKYRWGLDQVLECVAPTWAESLIRDDLSKRTGVDFANVTDQMIMEYFRNRSLNLQLVRDFQDALVNSGTGFGGSSPIMAYPGTIGFLLYHPDSFVIGQADVIDLSAIYDSTNITTNTFTRLFSEEGVLVGRRCFEPRYVEIDVCSNGLTGGYPDPTKAWALTCPAA